MQTLHGNLLIGRCDQCLFMILGQRRNQNSIQRIGVRIAAAVLFFDPTPDLLRPFVNFSLGSLMVSHRYFSPFLYVPMRHSGAAQIDSQSSGSDMASIYSHSL